MITKRFNNDWYDEELAEHKRIVCMHEYTYRKNNTQQIICNKLIGRSKTTKLPKNNSDLFNGNMFADFFCNKIDNILNNQPPVQEFPNTEDIDNLDEFYTPSNQFIYKQIMSIKSTSRDDHLPASVMHK